MAETATIVEETLQGILNVKAFSNEAYELTRYHEGLDSFLTITLRGARLRAAFIAFIVFALFGFIAGDDGRLGFAAHCDGVIEFGSAPKNGGPVGLQPGEEIRPVDQAIFGDLGVSSGEFARRFLASMPPPEKPTA